MTKIVCSGGIPDKTPADKRIERFWKAISGKSGVDAWTQTQKLRSEELTRRAAQIQERISGIPPEELTHEKYLEIWKELGSGQLPGVETSVRFAESFKDEGIRRINEVLIGQPYEARATVKAFTNALEGKAIPRTPGVKGGSAFTRLQKVFGAEAVEILSSPKELEKITKAIMEPRGVSPEITEYLRTLPDIPQGQSNLFGQFFTKEGVQYQMLPPLDPDILKLSSEEILERFGLGKIKDSRSVAQKQLDYWAMLRASGKLPENALEFPVFPDDAAIRQIALLPKTQRERIATFMKKSGITLVDLANLPRSILASFDVSGLLRQGIILTVAHPIEAFKTIRPMFQALLSKDSEKAIDAMIRARPHSAHADMYGLFRAPITTAKRTLTEGEEAFASTLTSKIPGISASARAYVTVLNDLRSRVWEKTIASWEKVGLKATPQDYTDLARVINWASGRGSYPTQALERAGGLLSALLFSPRLLLSRIEFPLTVLPMVTKSPLARREAQRLLLSFMGAGAAILGMIQLSGGGKIELDPRSADFGKLRIGSTRLDIWSGYAQLARFTSQMLTAEWKTAGGMTQGIGRMDVAGRFLQSKLSPAAGLIHDLLKGETYLGEELPPKSVSSALGQLYERMMPLAVQDLISAYEQGGISEAYPAITGLLGVGVVTYTDELQKVRDAVARENYGMSWEEVGRQYNRATQLRLEQESTKIQKAIEEQENRFAASKPSIMQQWRNEGQAVEDSYRNAVTLASQEFRATGDGVTFRNKIDQANASKRDMFKTRANKEQYKDIVAYYSQPLSPDQISKMNPSDVIRNEYYRAMYGADMYDKYGNYLFDLAAQKEQTFLQKYGQAAIDYIEEYQGSRWLEKPSEMNMLEQAREILQPYWRITDYIWSMYPPEMKDISDTIDLMERTNPDAARAMLKKYPAILRARELIARYKKATRESNPQLLYYYRLFYGG